MFIPHCVAIAQCAFRQKRCALKPKAHRFNSKAHALALIALALEVKPHHSNDFPSDYKYKLLVIFYRVNKTCSIT